MPREKKSLRQKTRDMFIGAITAIIVLALLWGYTQLMKPGNGDNTRRDWIYGGP